MKLELGKGGGVTRWLAAQRSPIHSFCRKVQDGNIAFPGGKKEKGKKMKSGRNTAFSFNHNKTENVLRVQNRGKLVINLCEAAGFPIMAPTHSGFNIIVLVNCGNAMYINDGLFQIGHCRS